VGTDQQLVGGKEVLCLHFVREVKPAQDDVTLGKPNIIKGNLGEGFSEDMWFGLDKGLVRLQQRIRNNVSMTWELVSFSGGQ
jgi:hypothetical protein